MTEGSDPTPTRSSSTSTVNRTTLTMNTDISATEKYHSNSKNGKAKSRPRAAFPMRTTALFSGPAVHLGPPPAHAHQEKTPVVEELGLLAFKGMPDELQDPSHNEQCCAIDPERVKKNGGSQESERKHDQRNAQAMANPVYGMSVAARVL